MSNTKHTCQCRQQKNIHPITHKTIKKDHAELSLLAVALEKIANSAGDLEQPIMGAVSVLTNLAQRLEYVESRLPLDGIISVPESMKTNNKAEIKESDLPTRVIIRLPDHEKLKEARLFLNLKRDPMANILDAIPGTYYGWEYGKRKIPSFVWGEVARKIKEHELSSGEKFPYEL